MMMMMMMMMYGSERSTVKYWFISYDQMLLDQNVTRPKQIQLFKNPYPNGYRRIEKNL